MKIEIRHHFSGAVICTAEVECDPDASESVKLVLAVKWALKNGQNLSGANLRGADLIGANLSGAYLSGANLAGAYLCGANLSGAYLRGADLSGANLRGADLSGADLTGAYLSGADLSRADLSRANLSGAYLRGADLRFADLRFANLSGADLRGAYLRFANLSGAYLRGAYLSGADLTGADLAGAYLSGADLSRANLRSAYFREVIMRGAVFGIDDVPVIPDIHRLVYEAASQDGALNMSNWHCGTAHCRAGWVVTLAGEAGKKLEDKIGTPAAAALIYMASDPKIDRIPDFYCSNEEALEDMKRLAEQEDA